MLDFILEFLLEIVFEGVGYFISKLFKYRIVKIVVLSTVIVLLSVAIIYLINKFVL